MRARYVHTATAALAVLVWLLIRQVLSTQAGPAVVALIAAASTFAISCAASLVAILGPTGKAIHWLYSFCKPTGTRRTRKATDR